MINLEKLEKQCKKLYEEIEKLKKEQSKGKLYDVVEFENFEWYVIDEDETSYTLFLKDKMSPEQCSKYFDKRLLDSDKDVKFNPNCKNIWWADSPVRMTLNSTFLKDLDKSEMELMTTLVSIDGQSRTTEDYVRLITKGEVENLPVEILKCSGLYGYWTMSPSIFSYWSYAFEFDVTSAGELAYSGVDGGFGVRPVIRVTKDGVSK